jgi:subtilisin family serine protease
MSEADALALSNDPRVSFVEEDSIVQISTTQNNATWGLDRSTRLARPLSTTYTYTSTGSGVNAHIIDTGIRITHTDFGGRASVGFDAIGDGRNGIDCNGHGTHVSGTVGGATWGVAKAVRLFAVRVLNCTGSARTRA